MKNAIISFIGGGNMAHSLIGGLVATGYDPKQIWAADPHKDKLNELASQYAINITTDNQAAVKQADIIILAVKPQILPEVANDLARNIQTKHPLVLSIAAGISIANLQKWLGDKLAIVRCMPNTPALVRCGAAGLYANEFVSKEQKILAESIMQSVGIAIWVDSEQQLDTVTALSGSGPAYFFLVMDALEQAAQQLGLSATIAQLLTRQTALGAARMALENQEDVGELRRRVTSPGGTTERAVNVLLSKEVPQAFAAAIKAAEQRSKELAILVKKEKT